MTERKLGPKEQAMREQREAKAKAAIKARGKKIGKVVTSLKVAKRGMRGR